MKQERNTLQKDALYTARIDGFNSEGLGVCHIEGWAVFVPNAIAGETCRLRIVRVGKHFAEARIDTILERSPHRVNRLCPDAKQCGGCDFWHMDYETELSLKSQRVSDALQRIGGAAAVQVPILPAESVTGYRNKAQFPVAARDKGAVSGFYRAGTHEIVPVGDCLIQSAQANLARKAVMEYVREHRVSCYDESTQTGLLRHIYVRCAAQTGQVLVCLVVNGSRLPEEAALVRCLREQVPGLHSVVLNRNTRSGNAVLGDEMRPLFGDGTIEDELCGLRFRLSARSFYQVNPAQAQRLYQVALEKAKLEKSDIVLDLYCGTGTITLCMAKAVKEAIGVEAVEAAVADARENAKRNGIANARFFCADAGEAARRLIAAGTRPDLIVVDPPRKGLSPDVIEAILQLRAKRVVYVSCDPATLSRDIRLLCEGGYALNDVTAVDMFPRCAHVETVACLSVKKPDDVLHVKLNMDEPDITK